MAGALKQTSFDRGVARELVLVLTASDNMADYRCDAINEAKKTISAHTRLKVHCESHKHTNTIEPLKVSQGEITITKKLVMSTFSTPHFDFVTKSRLFNHFNYFWGGFFMPVTAISMMITTKQEVLRRGQVLTLECQSGSSNPKASISWSLGSHRFGKAAGGMGRGSH